jgi:alkylation response protein AidB-like acyl-CoA dehydrogenase
MMEQQLPLLILEDLDPYPPAITRRAPPPPNVRRAALATNDKNTARQAKTLINVAKYSTSEMAVEVTKQCVWLHGGLGYMEDTGIARYMRDAEGTCIADCTPDQHVETVAAMLGFPGAEAVC